MVDLTNDDKDILIRICKVELGMVEGQFTDRFHCADYKRRVKSLLRSVKNNIPLDDAETCNVLDWLDDEIYDIEHLKKKFSVV